MRCNLIRCHWCGDRPIGGWCCGAEVTDEPGCPVRNAMADRSPDRCAPSVADETARERRVYDGGPREVR